ncbi:MAG: GNAT family N-acetyltransferase [Phycisphaeraceae bacterium]|nr:GNAT family N-acetyltransferase [Phycisphaeraceae bacterium]
MSNSEVAPEVRRATLRDSIAISGLLAELGFQTPADTVAARLGTLEQAGERVLVAIVSGEVVGLATIHITPVLHRPKPVGRITLLVVAERARNRGTGRAIVDASERVLSESGCGLVEITSNAALRGAHAFYERLGYTRTSVRFFKPLDQASA